MTKNEKTKISTWQLIFLSTGGMVGSGWLFSPYYGFQAAGVWVLLSWLIIAVVTAIIGLTFSEVGGMLPIVGGVSRFIGITHNRSTSFIFLSLGWLSYVVYLPLESESAVQYLGFWFHSLVIHNNGKVELSQMGMIYTFILVIVITWFNTLFIARVAKANLIVSVWKLFVPISIALGFILYFGSSSNASTNYHMIPLKFENVLTAITSSGLAFAFSGFQNGLILANNARNKAKSLVASVFIPILIGGIMYSLLSLAFILCTTSDRYTAFTAVAPLLGLVSLFGINWVYTILFIDAVIAPLGTANVFTAVTGRILYGLAKDFWPLSKLAKLNKYSSPANALWLSGILGVVFLFPFPTWKDLVNFLSSVVVFTYIAGPLTLIILRQECPEIERTFKVFCYPIVGYLAFMFCSLLIYWSGFYNMLWLLIFALLIVIIYNISKKSLHCLIKDNWVLLVYLLAMVATAYLHQIKQISFPLDNLIICIVALIFCKLFVITKLSKAEIQQNMQKVNQEVKTDE